MGHQMTGKPLLAFVVAAVASRAAWAAPAGVSLSADHKITIIDHGTSKSTPPLMHAPKMTQIAGNLGTYYPKGLYFCCYGFTITGPNSPLGIGQNWVAVAFTPAADATATEVDAGVGYVEGTNGVVLSLTSDAGGVPGTVLWSGNATGLGGFGSCCILATGKIKGGVALTAGTQYWITVTTNKKEANEFGAWAFNSTDETDIQTTASNTGSGWTAGEAVPGVSFGVYGK
jgi:hypothetical protein